MDGDGDTWVAVESGPSVARLDRNPRSRFRFQGARGRLRAEERGGQGAGDGPAKDPRRCDAVHQAEQPSTKTAIYVLTSNVGNATLGERSYELC